MIKVIKTDLSQIVANYYFMIERCSQRSLIIISLNSILNPNKENLMIKEQRDYESTIDRVDQIIRQNNRKYLDQKSQLQYEKALQQYEKHKHKQITRQYAQHIKEGNKKAIQKKRKQLSVNKAKSRIQVKSALQTHNIEKQPEKPEPKPRQKLSQKQLKKVQKAVEARAERHLQQMHLQKLNKQLQNQKKKTKLFQLTQTCQKLLSKSHTKMPVISDQIPLQRKILLQQFSQKAQQQVHELDGIISELIKKSKGLKQKSNQINNLDSQDLTIEKQGQKDKEKKGEQIDDIFSDKFEIEFMNQIILGREKWGHSRNQERQSPEDLLFTKPTSELFQMDYIPIN